MKTVQYSTEVVWKRAFMSWLDTGSGVALFVPCFLTTCMAYNCAGFLHYLNQVTLDLRKRDVLQHPGWSAVLGSGLAGLTVAHHLSGDAAKRDIRDGQSLLLSSVI